jgi:XTP/dITP diphosphohydrolase
VRPARILLVTGNQKKLTELREILTTVGISVVAPADINYLPEVEETGTTFEANAILKAEAGTAATGMWTIADDSGIEARALDWRPGVYSARYAGEPCDDEANNQKLIRELAAHDDKHVQYRCVIALARPGCETLTWSGIFVGQHTAKRIGDGGFGYDPYVFVPALGKTMAQLSSEEKHARSHRGQALRHFMKWLSSADASGSSSVRTSGQP